VKTVSQVLDTLPQQKQLEKTFMGKVEIGSKKKPGA
jgi:hypothetical protein